MKAARLLAQGEALKLALNPKQAAEACGVSLSHFQRQIAPYVRCSYVGRARLYRVEELDRWLQEQEQPPIRER
jgi:AraC-like DNA-binding protein